MNSAVADTGSQISPLPQKIRNATEPDNPGLIREFLSSLSFEITHSKNLHRAQRVAQFQLLMDTIADECLPAHWRCQCLDHVHIPLLALKRLADCRHSQAQVICFFHELRVTSHYFQSSLRA